jgi:hypothetical protein
MLRLSARTRQENRLTVRLFSCLNPAYSVRARACVRARARVVGDRLYICPEFRFLVRSVAGKIVR